MNIVELQYKPTGQEPGVVDIDKSSLYFGDRVTMFQPEKIIFKNDSVSIIKRGGLIQEYKADGIRVIYIYTMALLAYGTIVEVKMGKSHLSLIQVSSG